VAVFQPHRYTRTAHLLDDFARAFNQADVLLLTEIYPAGETPIPGVTGKSLYDEIVRFGHKDVHFEPDASRLPAKVAELALPGDIIIVLGAGNINRIVPELLTRLEAKP
jgi:UDP-N-acetylmuramate--alanine ligase